MKQRVLFLLVLLPALVFAQSDKNQDIWKPFEFLLGTWEGQGEGKSGISSVRYEFQFIFSQKYLQMKTRAEFKPQEKNPKGEIHEDTGFISYDSMRKKHIFRQFHVEGFVIQYVLDHVSDSGKILLFVSEQIENAPPGMNVTLELRAIKANEMRLSFNLAMPGQELECFSLNSVKRINGTILKDLIKK